MGGRQRVRHIFLMAMLAVLPLSEAAYAQQTDSPDKSATSGERLAFLGGLFKGGGKADDGTAAATPYVKSAHIYCPKVTVQPGTAAFIQYDRGREGDPLAVRYQVRFQEFARECIDLGAEAGIRIGLSARALVGPAGTPGQTMEVPIRFAVIDDKRQVVLSSLTRLRVTIPPGQNGVSFTHVEDMGSVPMPSGRLRGWEIRLGFDAGPKGPQG